MRRTVTFANEAVADLGAARVWLRQPGSGAFAERRWIALRQVAAALRRNPYLAPESVEHPGFRVRIVHGYRVFYEVNPDTGDAATAGDILIVAILGPGQPSRDL